MKKFKLILLLIIGVLTLNFNLSNVKAWAYNKKEVVYSSSTGGIGFGNYNYSLGNYYFNNNGDTFMGYCYDPTYQAPTKDYTYKADRIKPTTGAKDAGIFAILANGASTSTGDNKNEIIATDIALRAFQLGVFWDTNVTGYGYCDSTYIYNYGSGECNRLKAKELAYINFACGALQGDSVGINNLWKLFHDQYKNSFIDGNTHKRYIDLACTENQFKSDVKGCMEKFNNLRYSLYDNNSPSITFKGSDFNKVSDIAKKLFKIGVAATANFEKNSSNGSTATSTITITDTNNKNISNIKFGSSTATEKTQIFQLNLSNLITGSYITNVSINFSDSNHQGISVKSYEFSNDGKKWKTINSKTKLTIGADKEITGNKAYIRVTFSRKTDGTCPNVSAILNLKLYDLGSMYYVYKLTPNGTDDIQHTYQIAPYDVINSGNEYKGKDIKSPEFKINVSGCTPVKPTCAYIKTGENKGYWNANGTNLGTSKTAAQKMYNSCNCNNENKLFSYSIYDDMADYINNQNKKTKIYVGLLNKVYTPMTEIKGYTNSEKDMKTTCAPVNPNVPTCAYIKTGENKGYWNADGKKGTAQEMYNSCHCELPTEFFKTYETYADWKNKKFESKTYVGKYTDGTFKPMTDEKMSALGYANTTYSMTLSCSNEKPKCAIVESHYYDANGTNLGTGKTAAQKMYDSCNCLAETKYYLTYDSVRDYLSDKYTSKTYVGKYTDGTFKPMTDEKMSALGYANTTYSMTLSCSNEKPKCAIVGSHYYDANGTNLGTGKTAAQKMYDSCHCFNGGKPESYKTYASVKYYLANDYESEVYVGLKDGKFTPMTEIEGYGNNRKDMNATCSQNYNCETNTPYSKNIEIDGVYHYYDNNSNILKDEVEWAKVCRSCDTIDTDKNGNDVYYDDDGNKLDGQDEWIKACPKCNTTIVKPECSPDAEGNASIVGPSDIKKCVIDKDNNKKALDDAGNPYILDDELKDNKYCHTYCKEDYASIKLNRAITEDQGLKCGGYFSLKAKVEGTQTCYRANPVTGDKSIDIATFEKDMATATAENFEKLVNDFNACTSSWSDISNFKFDQTISWEYIENTGGDLTTKPTEKKDYSDLASSNGSNKMVANGQKESSDIIKICTGSVDNNYETCTSGWITIDLAKDNIDDFKDKIYKKASYDVCLDSNCTTKETKEVLISKARFVKKESKAAQEYTTSTTFHQVASSGPLSGAVTTNTFDVEGVQTTPIPGLPLSFDTVGGGIFKLKLDNLGKFYSDGTNNSKAGDSGRLVGYDDAGNLMSNSVASKVLDENNNVVWDGEYTCWYKQKCQPKDCPTCEFVCETEDGGSCHWEECEDCDIECVNCIFNLGKLQLKTKTVSTNNFNSANREYGYNWDINTDLGSLKLIKEKAEETIKNIEEKNTEIYNDNIDSTDSTLDFEVTLNRSMIEKILDYNKKAEENNQGGYGNDSLTCYDYGEVKNMFCYSDFIDELDKEYPDNIRTSKERLTPDQRSTENIKNQNYWTPWNVTYDNADIIGGPAWK